MVSPYQDPVLKSTSLKWTIYDDQSGRIHPHEPLERYTPGGFHPVALGDTFKDGCYVVRHKLGYGGFSTVWLASNEQNPESTHRYVAIKIKSSSSSNMGIDADPEVVRLIKLEEHYLQGRQDKPRPFVQLLDRFIHEGPNGRHNCLVTELLGPSLASVCSLYAEIEQFLRPETIMRASKQLLYDISAANIAFTCKSLLEDEDDDLLDLLSEVYVAKPWPDKTLPSPHLPNQLVQTAKWRLWEDETEEDIRLVDWGSAFAFSETVSLEAMAQPVDLRAPETFFIGKFDYRHDIWRTGCVMYMLFYQQNPFWVYSADNHFYLSRMMRKLGPLPESWLPRLTELRKESGYAEGDDKQYDIVRGDSQLICDTFEPRRQAIILEFSRDDPKYEPDEHTGYDFEALKSLRRPMLALLPFEPKHRATVRDSLEMIEWIDHRREDVGGDVHKEGEDDDREEDKGESGRSRKDRRK
ncbi:hypothetical protein J7T55_000721 [Diaporthe amygdali]|uniref:uncharacterized protein n=1 Tax=Phomopsis amygdali TaxID=1214568 RepID=UPI0022FED5B6|nr:uncharacterized protein J7T55_000721 [Diaporthe amygdali]KAJ0110288.1 hypothetical protein J7T55_000721 [Diaporthe amygdali]